MTDSFGRSVQDVIDEIGSTAAGLVRTYFDGRYSGAYFDVIADRDHPNQFTARDLIAPAALAIRLGSPDFWQDVLVSRSKQYNDLLASIPRVPIWAVAVDKLTQGEPAWQLWDLLREHTGIGPTTTSKLMAAKRPELIPIQDSVVVRVLHGYTGNFWIAMRVAMLDAGLRQRLDAIRAEVRQPHLALLRVLDILLWMHGTTPTEREELQQVPSDATE